MKYFQRASSQVQPDVAELLNLVEELRERESRLKTELLEQKLIKESVAIVPVLEREISEKDSEIERYKRKIECYEAENDRLRGENEFLHEELSERNRKFDENIRFMQAELNEIKRIVAEREQEQIEENSSSSSSSSSDSSMNSKVVDVRNIGNSKSGVTAKFLRKSVTQNSTSVGNFFESGVNSNNVDMKCETEAKTGEFFGVVESTERPRHSLGSSVESDGSMEVKSRAPRVPKPPPRPSSSSLGDRALAEFSKIPSTPPPPPPPTQSKTAMPPPPPPPPPLKGVKLSLQAKVKRVPEVVEFYHSLMRRDSNLRRDSGGGSGGAADALVAGAATKDMIGEIENRSAHLLAIKTDVETQGDFIKFLIKEVESAAFTDIEDVVPFVKWLDDELSYLVDERAVLKHFEWPEHKADALREAAFGYCDLKKLESQASSFCDDPRQPCGLALKKMQSLFEKLEHGVYNLSRMRESAMRRYKVFQIPVSWMLDAGYVSQIKLASVKLAMKYIKRVLRELEMVAGGPDEEELIVQGVKFAFRVHQFAGGFDVETMRAFQELRDKAQLCNMRYQNQHPQRYVCRFSAAC